MADRLRTSGNVNHAAGKFESRQVICFVCSNRRLDDDTGIVSKRVRQVSACKRFGQRSAGYGPTRIKEHKMVGQAGHFVRGVADIDDGNRKLIAQPLQVWQDFLLALNVERRQWLVHEQQLWRRQEGPGNRHTLAFTT